MDLGETIFKGLLRLFRGVRGDRDAPGEGAAFLANERDRLELLATLLFGSPAEVKPSEGAGGLEASTLLLPRHIDLYEREEANAEVYRYRVAFAAAARERGLHRVGGSEEEAVATLAALLAIPRTLTHLHQRYPATRALTTRLAGRELEIRGERSVPSTTRGALETLIRARLAEATGNGRDGEATTLHEGEQLGAWLRDTLRFDLDDPARIDARAEAAWRELRRIADHDGGAIPEVTIWGRIRSGAEAPGTEESPESEEAGARKSSARNVVNLERTIRLSRRKLGKREDKPLFHVFEKLETAEEYAGQSATPDASGNPEIMKDALDELSLGAAIRTTERPDNLVRAEVIVEPTGVEVAGRIVAVDPEVFVYPEWDHRGRGYREAWCTLTEERLVAGESGALNMKAARAVLRARRRHVEAIRGDLIRTLRRREMRRSQTEGPEIDVEAMVERHADLTAGTTPTDRLYVGPKRALRDFSVLILLDTSYSTDAWLDGRRVLDVGVESLIVLSAALEGIVEEEVSVTTFHSHTRNDVRVGVLKGFDDPWAQLHRTAPGIEPEGYTRIGAAIRHATACLDQTDAPKKLMLLLSDGKPTDYDRYEGLYGIEDISRAIREARQKRIHPFGLAIEKEAKRHLARMLGRGSYRILPRTSLLPEVMAQVFLTMLTD